MYCIYNCTDIYIVEAFECTQAENIHNPNQFHLLFSGAGNTYIFKEVPPLTPPLPVQHLPLPNPPKHDTFNQTRLIHADACPNPTNR